jgi:hypothetical protein
MKDRETLFPFALFAAVALPTAGVSTTPPEITPG